MSKYLPTIAQISREAIATGAALILVAFLVAKVPALKKLVQDYKTT